MAFRNDITVQWNLSPRIITIASPSTSVTIQDLHDTLREIEAYAENLVYPTIISSAGKEALGGGVYVGLTSTLLNAKICFEARKTASHSGVITSSDLTGRILTDNTATFVSDGVEPGAWIINYVDGSVCSVITVDSETQLTTNVLGGGADNRFELGDSYRVQNVTQCSVFGGNLVAVDSVGSEMTPILPAAGVQVIRTSSSSATLQELEEIQYASFSDRVTLNITSPYDGVVYPTGTGRQPVNNLEDAMAIAVARGFDIIHVDPGTLGIHAGDVVEDLYFVGMGSDKTTLVIDQGATVQNCSFERVCLSGTLDGGTSVRNCKISNLNYLDGNIFESIISGTISLGGESGAFLDCWCGYYTSAITPVIDFSGSYSNLVMRNYNGGITLKNKTLPGFISIDLNSGIVILDSSITAGNYTIRGSGVLLDNSTGSATVDTEGLINATLIDSVLISGSVGTKLNQIHADTSVAINALVAATTTTLSGSQDSVIYTALNQSNGFFDGMLATVIGAAGAVVRTISYYQNLSGSLHFETPLPFTPAPGDIVYVLSSRNDSAGRLR